MSFEDRLNHFFSIQKNNHTFGSLGTNESFNGTYRNLSYSDKYEDDSTTKDAILVAAYSIIIVVSLFGNLLVCNVVSRNKRLHTVTNLFIVNLAVSDILVTILNIPFNIIRLVLQEWIFGSVMCHVINFILMTSVYVSTFTLTVIALDRHQVIMYPLRPRVSIPVGVVILVVIWLASMGFSLPFSIYARVEEVELIISSRLRCRMRYPEPSDIYEQRLSVATILLQYVIPLSIITVAYSRIAIKLWSRRSLGHCTHDQRLYQARTKKKTIKMLIIVVVVFALCWMPLNLYHVLTDLHEDKATFQHNSIAFFVCHWLAISSVCYNPFVYCGLNDIFRAEVKAIFHCFFSRIYPRSEVDGSLARSSMRFRHCERAKSRRTSTTRTNSMKNSVVANRENGTITDVGPTEGDKMDLQTLLPCNLYIHYTNTDIKDGDTKPLTETSPDGGNYREVSPDESIFVEPPRAVEEDFEV